MKLLITGGAGYIGSHVALAALDRGYEVTVFDDLSTGLEENIIDDTSFIKGSTCSKSDLANLLSQVRYDGVIHLAASKAAGESMLKTRKYSENNIIGGINLINACIDYDIKLFVFSSTAAIYGKPDYCPVDEKHPLSPNNYYGYTKLAIENNLKWLSELKDIRYAALRYFNAAGYDINRRISGKEISPKNLIPIIMETAIGLRQKVSIFGNDYYTKDGTAIRDYIHVNDLARAHINSIEYLSTQKKNLIINLGSGVGYSVLEVVNRIAQISNKKIEYDFQERRLGDSDRLIAKSDLAKKLIGWETKYSDLNTIIKSSWEVYKNNQ